MACLRYLHPANAELDRLRSVPDPDVAFDYLGSLDAPLTGSSLFEPLEEPPWTLESRRGQRSHLLEIHCGVRNGELWMEWTFSRELHLRATIEELARRCLIELEGLIETLPVGPGGRRDAFGLSARGARSAPAGRDDRGAPDDRGRLPAVADAGRHAAAQPPGARLPRSTSSRRRGRSVPISTSLAFAMPGSCWSSVTRSCAPPSSGAPRRVPCRSSIGGSTCRGRSTT